MSDAMAAVVPMSPPDGHVRRVINTERNHLFNPSAIVTVAGRVQGRLTREMVQRAVELARVKHPLIGCRVEQGEGGESWFVPLPEGHGISIRDLERSDEHTWFSAVQEEFAVMMNPFVRPLIRFVLVREGDDGADLVIVANHAICDGSCLAILLRDMLEFAVLPADAVPHIEPIFPLSMLDLTENQPSGCLFNCKMGLIRSVMKSQSKKWDKDPHIFSIEDAAVVHDAYCRQNKYGIAFLDLTAEDSKKLAAKCHAEHVTINAALTAAFAAAHVQTVGPLNSNKVIIPYDLRRHSTPPPGDVFCLAAGGVTATIKQWKGSDFWSYVRGFHGAVASKLAHLPPEPSAKIFEDLRPQMLDAVALSYVMHVFCKDDKELQQHEKMSAFLASDHVANKMGRQYAAGSKSLGLLHTNLGRLDFPEKFGELKLERMWFSPSAGGQVLLLGSVGVSNTISVTVNYVFLGEDDPIHSQSTTLVETAKELLLSGV